MKTLFRWAFRLLILLLVLLIAGILLLDTIAKEIFEYKLAQSTGLEVKINSVNVGLLNPRLTVEGLVIYNRLEFGGSPLLDMPELHAEYDRDALWSQKVHLRLLRVNIAQISVIEDTNGRLNLRLAEKQIRQSGTTTDSNGHTSAPYQFTGIDTLNLTLGTGYFRSLKNPNMNETLTPHMTNEVYLRVNSPTAWDSLLNLILLKSGYNPLLHAGTPATDRSQYWQDKLKELGHK
jgi:hypothetical protein